jgi:hypothetical protein
MWQPQPLATLRASTACTGITLPFQYVFILRHNLMYFQYPSVFKIVVIFSNPVTVVYKNNVPLAMIAN